MPNGPSGRLPGRGSSPFSQVPKANIQRSVFDRSSSHKTTFDAGLLIPIYVDEALPGDTFTLKMNAFARLATPLKPLMDNLHMETFFFAVPNRLLWENWEKFNGAQDNPDDSTDFLIPEMTAPVPGYVTNSLEDYFGIPVGVASIQHSALWHRAYNQIWNQWFRDENLQNSVTVELGDGPEDSLEYEIKRRGKRHDYFTSCLPWPQKPTGGFGDEVGESIGIPVGSTGVTPIFSASVPPLPGSGAESLQLDSAGPDANVIWGAAVGSAGDEIAFTTGSNEQTGLHVLVNQLRESVQIQKLLERDARGGTRYTEIIRAHFGVTSPDSRLQRPEYLGGGYAPVVLNPVAQTSDQLSGGPGAETPQANLAAIGTANMSGHGFHKSFTEHCTLIGLVCVRADQTYQFGLDRMWSRRTRFDFYWPALAQIGEQAVLQQEITASPSEPIDVFGYQERYAEYRYKKSLVTGLFRSEVTAGETSLDIWHLAQDYGAGLPVLNGAFIEENPPVDRVIAVQDEPHFLFDSFISLKTARPMPVFGTPGFVDHF